MTGQLRAGHSLDERISKLDGGHEMKDMHEVETAQSMRFKWQVVACLWLSFIFHQGDRQLFNALISPISADLHLSLTRMGLIATSFTIVYGIFVPIGGLLGDLLRPNRVVIASLLLFSSGTLLSGLSAGFITLLLSRSLATGIGEATYFPSALTLIAKFHTSSRGLAVAIHQTANYLGVIFGSFVAGYITERLGWRSTFILVGVSGIVWALVFSYLSRAWPVASSKVPDSAAEPRKLLLGEAVRTMFRDVRLITFALGFACFLFVLVGYLTWMPTFLLQVFHESVLKAALYSVAGHHLAAMAGVLVGGWLGDRGEKTLRGFRLAMMGVACLLCAPVLVFCASAHSLRLLYAGLAVFGFLRGLTDSGQFAGVLDIVPERLRASLVGLILSTGFLGASLAPIVLARIAQQTSFRYGIQILAFPCALAGMLMLTTFYFSAKRAR